MHQISLTAFFNVLSILCVCVCVCVCVYVCKRREREAEGGKEEAACKLLGALLGSIVIHVVEVTQC